MLVIVTDTQILAPQQVCQGCLLADCHGQPRWRQGKLGCAIRACGHTPSLCTDPPEAATYYECQMGFRLANIDSD